MKKSTAISLVDVLIYLMNDLLGWFIVIWFDLTGYDSKFTNLKLHWVILVIGFVQIILSIIYNIFFYKKERTKYQIQLGKKLFVYNIIMTIFPYLYLAFTWFTT